MFSLSSPNQARPALTIPLNLSSPLPPPSRRPPPSPLTRLLATGRGESSGSARLCVCVCVSGPLLLTLLGLERRES